MSLQYEGSPDYRRIEREKSPRIEHVITPRALITQGGHAVVSPIGASGWYGLVGGKFKKVEVYDRNLLGPDGLPGLIREIDEEMNINLERFAGGMTSFGLSETCSVHKSDKRAVFYTSPIWLLELPDGYLSLDRYEWLDLNHPGSRRMMPDARAAITNFLRKIHDWAQPELWYVNMDPPITLDHNPPSWLVNAA